MWKPCILHATSSSGQGICSIYQRPASFWCLIERIKWHLIKWLHGDWPLSPTNLTQVLIRFCRWKFALTADILQKAFLYIAVHKDDWWFLWDCDGQVKVMRFRRVPFGNCSSPFLLNATVQHHLSLFPASGTVSELQHNLCSVRLADLIRTRNAMVFLFSLAEFFLCRVVNKCRFGITWRFVYQAMLIADLSTLSIMTWHQGESYHSWDV